MFFSIPSDSPDNFAAPASATASRFSFQEDSTQSGKAALVFIPIGHYSLFLFGVVATDQLDWRLDQQQPRHICPSPSSKARRQGHPAPYRARRHIKSRGLKQSRIEPNLAVSSPLSRADVSVNAHRPILQNVNCVRRRSRVVRIGHRWPRSKTTIQRAHCRTIFPYVGKNQSTAATRKSCENWVKSRSNIPSNSC